MESSFLNTHPKAARKEIFPSNLTLHSLCSRMQGSIRYCCVSFHGPMQSSPPNPGEGLNFVQDLERVWPPTQHVALHGSKVTIYTTCLLYCSHTKSFCVVTFDFSSMVKMEIWEKVLHSLWVCHVMLHGKHRGGVVYWHATRTTTKKMNLPGKWMQSSS